ncbi:MAG: DNRLRE domain-containing protein [Pseudomonadota bacterium]
MLFNRTQPLLDFTMPRGAQGVEASATPQNRRVPWLALAALLTLPLLGSEALAQESGSGTGTLVAEGTVFENEPDANGGNYPDVCIGNLMSGFMTRRGLMRYDLPAIPEGATITGVTLSMQQDRVRGMGTGPKAVTVELRRITDAWAEGVGGLSRRACGGGTSSATGSTWNNQPSTASSLSGSLALPTTRNFDFTFNSADNAPGLIADVQAWVDGEANNGWMVSVSDEDDPDNARLLEVGDLNITWQTDDLGSSSDFVINPGVNDAWFNPATAGQGFFFTVYPDSGLLFLSWFTYDSERPDPSATAILGEPGHRWITAIGSFDGNEAVLDATLTSGGIFDQSPPVVDNEVGYGTIFLEFNGCDDATVDYVFPDADLQGQVTVERVVKDNVALCEALQPDMTSR